MNDANEKIKKKMNILRRDMIYKLFLTIFEAIYITYILYTGIVLPSVGIITIIIGAHLAISSMDVYIIYKKDEME